MLAELTSPIHKGYDISVPSIRESRIEDNNRNCATNSRELIYSLKGFNL